MSALADTRRTPATTTVAAVIAIVRAPPTVAFLTTMAAYVGSCLVARLLHSELVELVPGRCGSCGYDLSGLNGPCPECGMRPPEPTTSR